MLFPLSPTSLPNKADVDRKQGQPLQRRESSMTPYRSVYFPNPDIRGREKIAILGGGDMGTRLGRAFYAGSGSGKMETERVSSLQQQAGVVGQQQQQHEVKTGSRHPGKPGEMDFVGYEEAVRFADVIMFAVPFDAIENVIDQSGGASAFTGKLILDCIHPSKFSIHANPVSLLPPGVHSCGEYLQQLLSSAHVVKFGMMEREVSSI